MFIATNKLFYILLKMIQIKKITAAETYSIRLEVLRKNVPLPHKFKEDLDEDTFHLGAFKNEKLIAVATFIKINNSKFIGVHYQLRGMATLQNYQGLGAGKLLIENAIALLKLKKIDILWCNARLIAVEFYKKQGLQIFGDKFIVPYVGEHYVMFIELN